MEKPTDKKQQEILKQLDASKRKKQKYINDPKKIVKK